MVPFYPFSFWVPLLKPNSRKKGTLIFKGLLGNLVHYNDDEMTKQGASMVGKLVVTGQEAVQNAKQGMREDIYKKHI